MNKYYNNTRLRTFRSNPREYYWKYESDALGGHGLDLTTLDKNLFFGELMHAGLEAMYRSEDWQHTAEDYANDSFLRVELAPEIHRFWFQEQIPYLNQLLSRYDQWRQDEDNFSIVGIEEEGLGQIGDTDYYHVYRTDLILEEPGGYMVLDHKGRGGSCDAKYMNSWHYSPQMWGYSSSWAKANPTKHLKGYKVNVLRKLSMDVADTKKCPQCSGTKTGPTTKNPTKIPVADCSLCESTGKVARSRSDIFVRQSTPFNQRKADLWASNTLSTIRQIEYNREMFETDPIQAWPMNPESYFTYGQSPFVDLDFESDIKSWWKPHPEQLQAFKPRSQDYVDVKTLIKEDMK